MELKTPDAIIAELVEIRAEASKGADALNNAEIKFAEASILADTTEARSLLEATGNVAERQATAKLFGAASRLDESIAKAEYNRIRTKLRILEQAQMSVQSQARMVELMYKTAGLGER